MSRFREGSDLTRLNRAAGTGRWVDVSRRLERALVAADRARRIHRRRLRPARSWPTSIGSGYRGAALGRRGVAGARSGRRIRGRPSSGGRHAASWPWTGRSTSAGIGKGLALRWAASAHRSARRRAMAARGRRRPRGARAGTRRRPVGHRDRGPVRWRGATRRRSPLDDGAVATSSVRRERWVLDGRPVHHLLDPRTGEPADGGPRLGHGAGADPAWAEVWSKVLFLGGSATIADTARTTRPRRVVGHRRRAISR